MSLSLYLYVHNSPSSYVDPLGLAKVKPTFVPGVTGDQQQQITIGFNRALNLVKSGECKDLFGCQGEAKLKSTKYGVYKGPSGQGAYTDPDEIDVRINQSGIFFSGSSDVYLPNAGVTYHLGDVAAVQAFIILHELGHELSDVTGFVPDIEDQALNETNSLKVLTKCFKDSTHSK